MTDKLAEVKAPQAIEPHKDNLEEYRAGAPKQVSQAQADATRILDLAANEMSPWRHMSSKDRPSPPPRPLETTVRDEMAKLNEDPARLEAALKLMTHQPKDHTVDVKVSKDSSGREQVSFTRPDSLNFATATQKFDVLSSAEEKGIQKMAALMVGSQDILPKEQLRQLADAVKDYGRQGFDLSRGLTNFAYELSQHPETKNIQAGMASSVNDGKRDDSLAVYGRNSTGYFHTDGRITKAP